jgi:DNA replication protein DnaC
MCSDESFVDRAKAAFDRKGGSDDVALLRQYAECNRQFANLKSKRGRRYEDCTFDNFQQVAPEQIKVVNRLREYASDSTDRITNGLNVVLFGPSGTGKDHLLMALAREVATQSGFVATWVNGSDFYDEMKRLTFNGFLDGSDYQTASVLWISDPLPPSGMLSEFQQSSLLRVVDYRYSQRKPIWVTLNVSDGEEAATRMGSQVVDRLRHGSLVCFCNWPSFRK